MTEEPNETPPDDDSRVVEERFRGLVEASVQGILVHHDFVPLFANQACADILGYQSPDEVVALGSLERVFASEELVRLRDYARTRRRQAMSKRFFRSSA